jgi:hypothetical protein
MNQNERVDIFVTWCIGTKAGLGYLEALELSNASPWAIG